MASQADHARPVAVNIVDAKAQGLLPLFDEQGEQGEQDDLDELAFYEGTLRVAEDDAGLALHKLDVRPGCSVGDNFSSIVTRNTARGVRANGTLFERSLIVKRVPARDVFRCRAAFGREAAAYCGLVPTLRRVCARAALSLPLARCLHAAPPGPRGPAALTQGLIVLEDLAALGFAMRPRQQGLDLRHALLVMEALGRFHGASLALARLDAGAFRQLRDYTDELIFFPDAEAVFSCSLRASATMAMLSLRRSGRHDLANKLAERVAKQGGAFHEMCAVIQPPSGPIPAVFTHGDCWANNLLFRYDQDGKPCEMRLVDLAGFRYASPVLDILHLLHTSVPRKVRVRHRPELLQRYLDALGATVQTVVTSSRDSESSTTRIPKVEGSSLDEISTNVFSMDQLEEEMRARASFGLWIGLWMLPAIFFSPDIIPVSNAPVDYFSEESQAYMCKEMPEEFHTRLLDLVEEQVENGTL